MKTDLVGVLLTACAPRERTLLPNRSPHPDVQLIASLEAPIIALTLGGAGGLMAKALTWSQKHLRKLHRLDIGTRRVA